jgi:hypothetical protein
VLKASWLKTGSKRRREILLPMSVHPQPVRPIRSETRATLVASIARGRRGLNEMIMDSSGKHRTARRLQPPPGQHDNLAGLSTQSGEGADRRPTAFIGGKPPLAVLLERISNTQKFARRWTVTDNSNVKIERRCDLEGAPRRYHLPKQRVNL